jgi:multidrug transporter EmrE-like cation transporter
VTLHSAIPAGVKRITVMFNGVSLSGTDNILIQIGDAGGVETTGYISSSCNQAGTVVNSTAGFILGVASAAGVVSGALTLSLLSAAGFLWAGAGAVKISTSATSYFAGEKSLTAELTQLIMVVTGVDTFDAGSVSILYER